MDLTIGMTVKLKTKSMILNSDEHTIESKNVGGHDYIVIARDKYRCVLYSGKLGLLGKEVVVGYICPRRCGSYMFNVEERSSSIILEEWMIDYVVKDS